MYIYNKNVNKEEEDCMIWKMGKRMGNGLNYMNILRQSN